MTGLAVDIIAENRTKVRMRDLCIVITRTDALLIEAFNLEWFEQLSPVCVDCRNKPLPARMLLAEIGGL